jgi:hypothetical protein
MYLRDGRIFTVTDDPPCPASDPRAASEQH